MSVYELVPAVQACMIYLVMCIVDQSPEAESSSIELLMTIHVCTLSWSAWTS